MSAFVGIIMMIAAVLLVPRLATALLGLLLWCVVLGMALLVAVPLVSAVVGISML